MNGYGGAKVFFFGILDSIQEIKTLKGDTSTCPSNETTSIFSSEEFVHAGGKAIDAVSSTLPYMHPHTQCAPRCASDLGGVCRHVGMLCEGVEAGAQGRAAVDSQRGAADVCRAGREKKQRGCSDLVRCAKAGQSAGRERERVCVWERVGERQRGEEGYGSRLEYKGVLRGIVNN